MDPSILDAADWNYCASQTAFMGSSARGEVVENGDVQLASCGFPLVNFNTAWLKPPIARPAPPRWRGAGGPRPNGFPRW